MAICGKHDVKYLDGQSCWNCDQEKANKSKKTSTTTDSKPKVFSNPNA